MFFFLAENYFRFEDEIVFILACRQREIVLLVESFLLAHETAKLAFRQLFFCGAETSD